MSFEVYPDDLPSRADIDEAERILAYYEWLETDRVKRFGGRV